MGWLLAVIIGALVGWLVSYSVNTPRSIMLGILTGAIGGIAGPLFFGNLIGLTGAINATLGSITFLGFLWSLIGGILVSGVSLGVLSWPTMVNRREVQDRSYAEEVRAKNERNRRE